MKTKSPPGLLGVRFNVCQTTNQILLKAPLSICLKSFFYGLNLGAIFVAVVVLFFLFQCLLLRSFFFYLVPQMTHYIIIFGC